MEGGLSALEQCSHFLKAARATEKCVRPSPSRAPGTNMTLEELKVACEGNTRRSSPGYFVKISFPGCCWQESCGLGNWSGCEALRWAAALGHVCVYSYLHLNLLHWKIWRCIQTPASQPKPGTKDTSRRVQWAPRGLIRHGQLHGGEERLRGSCPQPLHSRQQGPLDRDSGWPLPSSWQATDLQTLISKRQEMDWASWNLASAGDTPLCCCRAHYEPHSPFWT